MVCHMTAQDMYAIGAISDKEMREYDRECLVSPQKKYSESTSIPKQSPIPVFASN